MNNIMNNIENVKSLIKTELDWRYKEQYELQEQLAKGAMTFTSADLIQMAQEMQTIERRIGELNQQMKVIDVIEGK